jgi:hypothetical protein
LCNSETNLLLYEICYCKGHYVNFRSTIRVNKKRKEVHIAENSFGLVDKAFVLYYMRHKYD